MDTTTQLPTKRGLHSQALDLLRFPLALIIVLAHVFPNSIEKDSLFFGLPYNFENYPVLSIILNLIFAFLRQQSVPIYYFISGYVFFIGIEHFTKETYIQKLKNRTKTLVIPYFIWNTIFLIITIVYTITAKTSAQLNFSISGLLSAYWAYDDSLLSSTINTGNVYPINYPLWFLRNLIIVVLTAPIIYGLIKRTKYLFVLLLGGIWFATKSYEPSVHLSAGFITAFFFFSWGAYMSIFRKNMIEEFGRFRLLSMILYPGLGFLCFLSLYIWPEATIILKQLSILAGLLFAYNLAVYLLKNNYCKVNKFLAESSFFIYVSHCPIVTCVLIANYAIVLKLCNMTMDMFSPIFLYPLRYVATITVALTSFYLIKRYVPSLLKILTGRK